MIGVGDGQGQRRESHCGSELTHESVSGHSDGIGQRPPAATDGEKGSSLFAFVPGDRVRYSHFGEWRNATLTELFHDGLVARVENANGSHTYVRAALLVAAVDE